MAMRRLIFCSIIALMVMVDYAQDVLPTRRRGGLTFSYDTFESYANNDLLNGKNGGFSGKGDPWNGAYVDRQNAFGIQALDTFEQYSNGNPLNGLNLGVGFTSAFVDRQFAFPGLTFDTFESYSNGQNLDGLNGGSNNGSTAIVWNGAFVAH